MTLACIPCFLRLLMVFFACMLGAAFRTAPLHSNGEPFPVALCAEESHERFFQNEQIAGGDATKMKKICSWTPWLGFPMPVAQGLWKSRKFEWLEQEKTKCKSTVREWYRKANFDEKLAWMKKFNVELKKF